MNSRNPSEFEVQAEAYWNLKGHFPYVRGEYTVKFPEKKRGVRLDLLIMNNVEDIVLIIEVKRSARSFATTQGTRYAGLVGCPCMYIRGMKDAKNALALVRDFIAENNIEIL